MEQLLQNPLFVGKMKRLSPGTRRWFIDSLIDLFDQESEYVIDVIEDCRDDMRDLADGYQEEAEQLRAASRLLHEKRESPSTSPKRSVSRISAPSRLLYVNERQGTQDSIRLRHRRRRLAMSDDGSRCVSSLSVSSLSVPSLPVLVDNNNGRMGSLQTPSHTRGTRSLPVTPLPSSQLPPEANEAKAENAKRMQEETNAILQTMNAKESHLEKERERQQERIERLRRQKRFLAEDRTTQALKLLEKALEMDEMMARDKERQGLQLRNKMDEMKKRKDKKQDSEFVEIIELQDK